jgi:hypothetical protein
MNRTYSVSVAFSALSAPVVSAAYAVGNMAVASVITIASAVNNDMIFFMVTFLLQTKNDAKSLAFNASHCQAWGLKLGVCPHVQKKFERGSVPVFKKGLTSERAGSNL